MKRKNPNHIKIIFLDHDGVLVPRGFDDLDQEFSPNCVSILNDILYDTNAEIVVSSDWRLHYNLKSLCDIYKNSGVIKCPISITPDFWTKNSNIKDLELLRTNEILFWLKNNKVDKWVAIDDMELLLENFVLTDGDKGLVQREIKNKILKFLL